VDAAKAKRRVEIGVEEASKLLGVSERMVRLYIDERRIRGLKVGRKWFIDLASVEYFLKSRSPALGPEGSSPAPLLSEVAPEVAEVRQKLPRNHRDPRQLAPFRLLNQWIGQHDPILLGADPGFSSRLKTLLSEALSEMGAGYFSFGSDKVFHYRRARGAIGGILGMIYSRQDDEISSLRPDDLQLKVLPALSSLLRAMERKSSRSGKKTKSSDDP
jgi:excisionase family DNA binding protein